MDRYRQSLFMGEQLEPRLTMSVSPLGNLSGLMSLSTAWGNDQTAAVVTHWNATALKVGATSSQRGEATPVSSDLAAVDLALESMGEPLDVAATRKEPTLKKGVSLVGLPRYSTSTVNAVADVLTERGTPKHIGFSFAASLSGSKSQYGNAWRLTQQLLDNKKSVTITPFLGFHGIGSSLDETAISDEQLATRVAKFVKFAQHPYGKDKTALYLNPKVHLILSPSLEDNYATHEDFVAMATKIAGLIPSNILTHLTFQRTPSPAASAPASGAVDVTAESLSLTSAPDATGTPTNFPEIKLLHEIHALPSDSGLTGYDSLSNDGFFLRANINSDNNKTIDENEDTANNTLNGVTDRQSLDDKPELSKYLTDIKDQALVEYFWRPWMNLFDRELADQADTKKDVAGYSKTGLLQDRKDLGQFDDLEANVLRKFLGTAPKKGDPIRVTSPPSSKAVDSPAPLLEPQVPVNQSPVVNIIERTTRPGKSTNIHVADAYFDPEGDALTIGDIQQPAHGIVVRDPNHAGRIIYSSDAGYVGTDSFTYEVVDAKGARTIGTVTLLVLNQNPVATSFVRQTTTGKATNLHVSKYFSDPDGDVVTIDRIKQPAHGRVVRDPDNSGRLIYTSDAKFRGTDEFQILLTDGFGGKTWMTIRLEVSP